MANRRHNPRLAKSLRCFTIVETAELYGVHRNTVRHWLADGLKPLDARKPVLIHGTALNRFHADRRGSAKRVCGPDEMYCLPCRAPRRPASDMADYSQLTASVGTLVAICPACDRMMAQRVNAARLKQFSTEIDVTIRPGPEPIEGSA
ncbi:helix-turn-helix domain-containing protein [Mesorhizobium sp. PAMC28654]|uniref:helix-turn-helix domain-containing protein n=1 Tax=Mesorhizobium sp. PAMC28654 TaxID=2880934 RepID=UPI001D0ABE54|nr:helix-turn-helix domain-containing protein [Mesorhizobium sp. PAMC28654]UDL87214.1 helix-turn-helix domain-containing protein [Mesorhizobium sp. PAMC28654]